ncbi:OmpA family protein [Rhodobacteraceae bacterium NNCM2]|nr:OmpA family protein [Coraliihabitans acroporae]
MRWLSAMMIACAALAPATAQEAPDVLAGGAPDGAVQTAYTDQDFNSYAMPIAPFGTGKPATETIEGRVIWSAYRLDDDATTADLMAGYRTWLDNAGFTEIFDCFSAACGGFDFRFEAAILPAPGMLMDVADFRQLTMEREGDGAHASILVSRVLNSAYIQTVLVVPNESGRVVVATPNVETPAETVILPGDEKALYDRLIEEGHVRIDGLEFETGGASISEGSSTTLDLLARLLNRNDIAVVIVGHSDNVGGYQTNMELSKKRANAVMAALEARGVESSQLSAEGVGYLAPLASNASPEGRSINRRVELVLN